MDMTVNYEKSICFSTELANQLNEKAFSIDCRLYLFAYYEPKKYIPAESFQSRFSTAVINLYGLFWDCCPFMKFILETPDSILSGDWWRIKSDFTELRNIARAFRSIFCHNNSDRFPFNAENYDIAEDWIYGQCSTWLQIFDLNESHWERLLQTLVEKADEFAKDLMDSLDRLSALPLGSPRREAKIDHWIEAIAGSYLRNPDYLLNAMAAMYLLFLKNSHERQDSRRTLRDQTIDWIANTCYIEQILFSQNKWAERWLDKPIQKARESKVYQLLLDWPNQWASLVIGRSASECDEPPMPGSDFLKILAKDVYDFAQAPHLGYTVL